MTVKNIFYAQSGGVTAVINASACGVIQTARANSGKLGTVYAGENGIMGALTENLIDTAQEHDSDIAALKHTPAGCFGSCRYKLKSLVENKAEYERLVEVFSAHNIGYFLYNGGGDSADTCLKVSQLASEMGHPIQAVHIPKTIDNDLPFTDTCPGFGSVAKYVAVSALEASLDVASMAKTSTKVFILEVMGRHTGWIASAGGLIDPQVPAVLLLPEVVFDESAFIAKVKQNVERFGYCTVVVSEGVKSPNGQFLADQGTTDSFGHAQLGGVAPVVANLIKTKLNYKYHWAVADYLQRSARHLAAKNDVEQAYALGCAAVEAVLAGESGIMLTIERMSDEPYQWQIGRTDLAHVANVEKTLPSDFICADGFGITKACRQYLKPLIDGEDYPPYKNGLPQYAQLKKAKVRQKLEAFN